MEHTAATHRSSPKDVFLHLLAIITLYVSAGSFITLLFQYVNVLFPDRILDFYSLSSVYGAIRWSIASLVIVFPVFIVASWLLERAYRHVPAKREYRLRKWLVYFTLFLAGLIMMGDLVALIYQFLSGDLTVRFFLKIVVVLAVAGCVFGYYLYDIKKHRTE
jgi:hypothetical protein